MSILPLPQFEADLDAARKDQEAYDRLKPPSSMVLRFGAMKLIGEYPYSGDAKPGCGSKLVVRTHRGTEMGEMLTSTCPNAGCAKSITRKEMLEYIDRSGGRDYPFFTDGRVLRVATLEDMNAQSRLDAQKHTLLKRAREIAETFDLPMKVVEAEPILGGERMMFYFIAEERVDFRELVRAMAEEFKTRIELRQVGARDEARLTADYERCGQHCCCKNFLKVLKPVSMRSAKVQKATLDPLKISGRCGRLMCCLRYEDETYEDLRRRLPRRNSRVGTPEGPGTVVDAQILTQLVLVRLENEAKQIAVPVEELCDPDEAPKPKAVTPDPFRGKSADDVARQTDDAQRAGGRGGRGGRGGGKRDGRSRAQQQDRYRKSAQSQDAPPPDAPQQGAPDNVDTGGADTGGAVTPDSAKGDGRGRRRRRRGRGRGRGRRPDGGADAGGSGGDAQ